MLLPRLLYRVEQGEHKLVSVLLPAPPPAEPTLATAQRKIMILIIKKEGRRATKARRFNMERGSTARARPDGYRAGAPHIINYY